MPGYRSLVEFINTVSLFAPVDLARGWGKEEQLEVCSVPTELKETTLITEISTIKAHDSAWICLVWGELCNV